LLGGSVECVALLVGNGEFHDGGSTHVHTSEKNDDTYRIGSRSVGRSMPVASYRVGFLPDLLAPFATLRSLLEVGGSPSNYAERRRDDTGLSRPVVDPPVDRIVNNIS
jgi:hypothetical protein